MVAGAVTCGQWCFVIILPENGMNDWLLYPTGRYRAFVLALAVMSLLWLVSPGGLYAATGIDGTVTDGATGIPGIPVYVWTYDAASGWSISGSAPTNGVGGYSFAPLPAGSSYRVCFYGTVINYQNKCHANAPDYASADPVTVVTDSMTTIDMTLLLVGKISGTVKDSISNAALPGISVEAYDSADPLVMVASATTDAGGGYTIYNLPDGTYSVYFNGYALGYLSQELNNIDVLAPAETTGTDASMVKGGSISGTVTDSGTSAVLQGISVEVYQGAILIDSTSTGADGTYTVVALPAGTYDVFFDGTLKGYNTVTHNGVAVALSADTVMDAVLTAVVPPLNDTCGSARTIPGFFYSNSVDTTSATDDAGVPETLCDSPGSLMNNGVWYQFTPAYDGTVVLDTLGSNYDTILHVYTGTCGSLVSYACNDDIDLEGRSSLNLTVTAGTTYYIMVSSFSTGGGSLVLNLTAWELAVQPLGSGVIESSPAGISCGSLCSAYFPVNNPVSLAASGINGISTFVKWGGACSGNVSPCPVSSSTGGSRIDVSAKFDACSNHSVFFLNDTFDSISSAYASLAGTGEFDLRATITYSLGLLEFSSPGKDVTLKGGLNCSFQSPQAPYYSVLSGTLVISNGTVTADGIAIGN